MIVNSTELQNNFGKYLYLSVQEEIIITKNGIEIAKLCAINKNRQKIDTPDGRSLVMEEAAYYSYGGRKASWEEFIKLTKGNEERYEYIDGEIYFMTSPKAPHQIALTELHGAFYNWFKGKKCIPMIAPYDINLKRDRNDKNRVQPDLMVICDHKEKISKNGFYMGIPVLLVEIISENTHKKDLVRKFELYMESGIREYWIVNPLIREIRVYLFKNKEIESSITFIKDDIAVSYCFEGLSVKLADVFDLK
jgi:Uma2 family endonuclease